MTKAGLVDPEKETGVSGYYVTLLKGTLNHPGKVLLATLVLLFLVPAVFTAFGPGFKLSPPEEPRAAMLEIKALGNLSI